MDNLGLGKPSVGTTQSTLCEMAFINGDILHPNRNIEKMSSGQPLDDAVRTPWFTRVGPMMSNVDGPAVIGRSVLKGLCRDWIQREVTESRSGSCISTRRRCTLKSRGCQCRAFHSTHLVRQAIYGLEAVGPR